MNRLVERWLPVARIQHPWPTERFDATTRGGSPVRAVRSASTPRTHHARTRATWHRADRDARRMRRRIARPSGRAVFARAGGARSAIASRRGRQVGAAPTRKPWTAEQLPSRSRRTGDSSEGILKPFDRWPPIKVGMYRRSAACFSSVKTVSPSSRTHDC
jgi:hypothetical protein